MPLFSGWDAVMIRAPSAAEKLSEEALAFSSFPHTVLIRGQGTDCRLSKRGEGTGREYATHERHRRCSALELNAAPGCAAEGMPGIYALSH
jgi:hypothetical protein